MLQPKRTGDVLSRLSRSGQDNPTKICVTYLSFNSLEIGFCLTDNEFEGRLRSNVLYDYAARNWGHHAHAASIPLEQMILGFLENEARVSASSQAMMTFRHHAGYSQRVPRQIGLHLTAHFGFREAMVALLKNGHDLNAKDTWGRVPLTWAAKKGHELVVELMLSKDGVDPNSWDETGRTPLLWAAENGHEAVVKLLLGKNGVDPDWVDKHDESPLWCAANNGHDAVVKLLLAEDEVNPNSVDGNCGWTPLGCAAAKRHEAVVKLLLAKDVVDPDPKDSNAIPCRRVRARGRGQAAAREGGCQPEH